MSHPDEFIRNPFTICVDTREQLPYRFNGIKGDSKQKGLPIAVEISKVTLKTGDYSIEGLENRIAIERKSLEDAYSSFIHDRKRFERELERLSDMEFSMVIVEALEDDLYQYVQRYTSGNPKSVYRSVISWRVKYGIHFCFANSRQRAMRDTFRHLQYFWKQNEH